MIARRLSIPALVLAAAPAALAFPLASVGAEGAEFAIREASLNLSVPRSGPCRVQVVAGNERLTIQETGGAGFSVTRTIRGGDSLSLKVSRAGSTREREAEDQKWLAFLKGFFDAVQDDEESRAALENFQGFLDKAMVTMKVTWDLDPGGTAADTLRGVALWKVHTRHPASLWLADPDEFQGLFATFRGLQGAAPEPTMATPGRQEDKADTMSDHGSLPARTRLAQQIDTTAKDILQVKGRLKDQPLAQSVRDLQRLLSEVSKLLGETLVVGPGKDPERYRGHAAVLQDVEKVYDQFQIVWAERYPNAIKPLSPPAAGIPEGLQAFISGVRGNTTWEKARLILIADTNHDDPVLQSNLIKFVNGTVQAGDVLLREGRERLKPLLSQHSLIQDRSLRRSVTEVGWDDMELFHRSTVWEDAAEKFSQNLKAMEREGKSEAAGSGSAAPGLEELSAEAAKLQEALPAYEQDVLHGRTESLKKALRLFDQRRVLTQAGDAHYPPELLTECSARPTLVITIKGDPSK
jgi:hypothetical protein